MFTLGMVNKGHHGISDTLSHFKHNLSGKRTLCNPPGCPIWRHWRGGDPLEVVAAGGTTHPDIAAVVSPAVATTEDCALELLPTLFDGSRRESANGEKKRII